jgi:hypothetical protein
MAKISRVSEKLSPSEVDGSRGYSYCTHNATHVCVEIILDTKAEHGVGPETTLLWEALETITKPALKTLDVWMKLDRRTIVARYDLAHNPFNSRSSHEIAAGMLGVVQETLVALERRAAGRRR